MSDFNNEVVRTVLVKGRTALGITLGLACSIPLSTQVAMASPDGPRLHVRQGHDGGGRGREARLNIQPIEPGANFNLNSGRAVFNAGNLGNFTNLTIDVGGHSKIVNMDSKLTAGEFIAAQQALNGGQTIQLKNNGAAFGGSISLNNSTLSALNSAVGGSINSLTIARGVEVTDTLSALNVSGTFRNYGNFSAASNVAGATDSIGANNIINGRGGSIQSYTGADLFGADVTLNGLTSVTNNGSISSANNLTINAPTINNVQDGNAVPTITAGQNVNLNTQNLINEGMIAATAGNINVASNGALNLAGAGTLQAAGDINLKSNNADLTTSGGNFLSQNLNFDAGTGNVSATVGQVDGVVNANACIIHIFGDSDNLNMGAINATGDPFIQNNGDITISAGNPAATNGAPLTIISGRNVISNGGVLDTSNGAGDGGLLTVVAGAKGKTKNGVFTLAKKSKTGGLIDLTGGNGGGAALTLIDTTGTTADGNIQMFAYAGKGAGTGSVTLPSITVDAGVTGNVTIIGSTKSGSAVTNAANITANNLTVSAGAPVAKLGFNTTTGAQVSGTLSVKGTVSGNVDQSGSMNLAGDLTLTTGGDLNISGNASADGLAPVVTIAANNLNIQAGGSLTGVNAVATANVVGATTVDGSTNLKALNLTTNTLLINPGGQVGDTTDNITAKGVIQVDGTLGRDPLPGDTTQPPSLFNVTTAGAFNIGGAGVVSGDGAITAATITNNNLGKGNIAYTATSKSTGGFTNFGTIDGLNVSVTSNSIVNAGGANLQATLQTTDTDVPTLTLNTSLLDNQGHIEAVGETKLTAGSLVINGTGKTLTITGVDNGFFANFNSSVTLNATGDITVGGIVANVNSNPFGQFNTLGALANFTVNTEGKFSSTLPGINVYANAKGDPSGISITADSVVYNGVGAAPNFFLNAFGDVGGLSIGDKPVTLNLTGKNGITIGNAPGQFNILIDHFDTTSVTSITTPGILNVDMANFVFTNGNTGIVITGTKNLLVNGTITGGDNVTVNTSAKKDFIVGDTSGSGTGINGSISAAKDLTINSIGGFVINNGQTMVGIEHINLNGTSLTVEAGGDASSLDMKVNMGSSSKAKYVNLNANGFLSASSLTLNTTGNLTLDSGGGNAVETHLSIGLHPVGTGADNLGGGGYFIINAGDLKFSSQGVFFDAAATGAGPDGGKVDITLSTNKSSKIGLGKGSIRADVSNQAGTISADGAGEFSLSTPGTIVAEDVLNGAINFGFDGGAFSLTAGGTVSAANVSGYTYNLFALNSGSTTPMLLANAGKNGIKDDTTLLANFMGGGNLVFHNFGTVDTNGIVALPVKLDIQSQTSVDARDNAGFVAFSVPSLPPEGGEIVILTPTLLISNSTGLALNAFGEDGSGGKITVTTTSAATAGNLSIGLGGGNLSLDVGTTTNNTGGHITVNAGGALKVDGLGLNFGAATNKAATLDLISGQATTISSGSPITLNNMNAAGLAGLSLGTATINSGSSNTFFLSGVNANTGNGFSGTGDFTAGKIIISPQAGKGAIDTTGYNLTTFALELTATTITFPANQTISVVSDGVVGSGSSTGNGGSIQITATDLNFNNNGGVLLQAQGNAAVNDSIGGIIKVFSSDTKDLELGANGFTFDVSDAAAGASKGGSVVVKASASNLIVDGNAFTYGTNDGGVLNLQAQGEMLVSNVAALNPFYLDKITFETDGGIKNNSSAFSFGSATTNGIVDVNPTLQAYSIEVISNGKGAGIDTSTGTFSGNILTLTTTGNVNFASGGTVAVTPFASNGNGGSIYITAAGLTQSGGNLGYTLDASGSTGAGGLIDIKINGTADLIIGAGNLNIDISNAATQAGGFLSIQNNGNIIGDISAINFGSNFNGSGPNLVLTANGVLAVNNLSTIANIGFGGANFVTATFGGVSHDGCVDTIRIINAGLPGGFFDVIYTENGTEGVTTVANAFYNLINNNPLLTNLGISAVIDPLHPAVVTIRATSATTYTVINDTDPDCLDANGNRLLTTTLQTFTTGITFNSRSSQAFQMGGAAAGSNGIQDNNLTLNIGAVTISNTGSAVTATIGGQAKAGLKDTFIVIDPRLAGGQVELEYTFVDGDTRATIAAAFASLINTNVALQNIGVTASSNQDVLQLASTGTSTTYAADTAKTSKITIATIAEGGNISNGTLTSINGPATGPVTLTASGSVGALGAPILANGGANTSFIVNAGKDADLDILSDALLINMSAAQNGRVVVHAGDVGGLTGTSGSLNFQYNNANLGNTNSVTINDLSTTSGDLFVRSNSVDLNVSGSSTVSSNLGNITLLNYRPGGNIDIGNDVVIHGSGAVNELNQGNVYIGYDAVPFGGFSPGNAPAGVTINVTQGGQVTFAQAGDIFGSITSDPTATFQGLGRHLAFFEGSFSGSLITITVGANAVITADPPPYVPTAAVLNTRNAGNGSHEISTSTSAPAVSATVLEHSSSVSGTNASAPSTVSLSKDVVSTTNLNGMLSALNTINLNNAQLSEASLSHNAIVNTAGLLISNTSNDGVNGAALNQSAATEATQVTQSTGTVLNGEVSNVEHRSLARGPVLLAPVKDTVLETPHGSVSIAAKSLALIIVNDAGVAVYNLHDNRKHAVQVTHNNSTVSVAPGCSAVLADAAAKSFEEINPAQFVRYRGLVCKPMSNTKKLYKAEFQVMSLLGVLPTVKEMINSSDAETRKTMQNVIKTTAILMQLGQGGEKFRHYVAPKVTAYNAQ